MRSTLIALLVLLFTPILVAQKLLTPEDAVNPAHFPQRLAQLQWLPDVDHYT